MKNRIEKSLVFFMILNLFIIACNKSNDSNGPISGTFINATNFNETVDENSVNGTVLAGLSATASDDSSITYTLDNQNVSGGIALSTSGELIADITDISYMFLGATNFNQDISSWDVSSATNSSEFSTGSALDSAYYPNFN